MPARKLLRGAAVITMDPTLGTLACGDVLIEDEHIAAVAPSIEAEDCEVIDAGGAILVPGFVDTHRHMWQTGLRSLCSNMSTVEYLWSVRLHIAQILTPRDLYIATFVGGLEALNAGVTTISAYEHNISTDEDAGEGIRGMRESGVRGVFGFGMLSPRYRATEWRAPADRREILSELKTAYTEDAGSLVDLGLCPGEFAIGGPDSIVAEYEIAKELGLPIAHHAAPLPGSGAEIRILDEAGMLGPDVIVVHGNALESAEYGMLKAAGSSVSVQTEVELGMALGTPTLVAQREAGLDPTLGIDTVATNSGDMLSQMRLALNVVCLAESQKLLESGASPLDLTATCDDALAWGTINGARALGLEQQIGSISPGKRADLVTIRRDGLMHAGGFSEDPAAAVVAQASVADIDSVIVNGAFVKRDGRLVRDDVGEAIGQLEDSCRRILADTPRTDGLTGFRSLIPDPPPELPLVEISNNKDG